MITWYMDLWSRPQVLAHIPESISSNYFFPELLFSRTKSQRVSPRALPRVSDRILCMTLGETLSETRFFTRESNYEVLFQYDCCIEVVSFRIRKIFHRT